jgi:hypothetical protein
MYGRAWKRARAKKGGLEERAGARVPKGRCGRCWFVVPVSIDVGVAQPRRATTTRVRSTHLAADHDDARQLVREQAAGRAGRVAELRANLAQAVDEPDDALEPLRGLVGCRHDWAGVGGGEAAGLMRLWAARENGIGVGERRVGKRVLVPPVEAPGARCAAADETADDAPPPCPRLASHAHHRRKKKEDEETREGTSDKGNNTHTHTRRPLLRARGFKRGSRPAPAAPPLAARP